MTTEEISALRAAARVNLLAFMEWCWWMPGDLHIGRHTIAICERLTKAVDDWRDGKSTYLMIDVPYRHGKSDIVSRALPSWFLGYCSDREPDVILSGYSQSLSETFSRKCMAIVGSKAYSALFPEVKVSDTKRSADEWKIEGSAGTVTVSGLGGSITGKGGHLIILDDYCKNAEEANSRTYRDKTWESFSSSLMTRTNAPAAIVIVCATRWHVDDIGGRILEHMAKDKAFPRFERLSFPARLPGVYDTLFPEHFNAEWYANQRASLSSQAAAALLDCSPTGDTTRWFRPEWKQVYTGDIENKSKMNIYVVVDTATSKKKNSDYTTMFVIGFGCDRSRYVLDIVHDRLDLSERTDALFDLVRKWDPSCVFWESVGAMSDAEHMRIVQDDRGYHFRIVTFSQRIPKEDRIRWLKPDFEHGRWWFPTRLVRRCSDGKLRDHVMEFFLTEFNDYPAVRHDDMLDCLADVYHPDITRMMVFPRSGTGDGGNRTYSTGIAYRQ